MKVSIPGQQRVMTRTLLMHPNLNSVLQSLVVTEDSEASLAAILQHSIISSQEQIHAHFDSILSKKGTKILIWNIRRLDSQNESKCSFFLFVLFFTCMLVV